jgi:prepilin-type processing-associated H-X9-DG protein
VVITIISILMALLLPALSRVKVMAKCAKCTANMRAIGTAWNMYANDNNDIFPQNYQEGTYGSRLHQTSDYFYGGIQLWMTYDAYLGSGGNAATYSGIGYVYPYLKTLDVFFCPANPRSDRWMTLSKGQDPSNTDYGFGEQAKGAICTYYYRGGMYPVEGYPITAIADPPACRGDIGGLKRASDPNVRGRVILTDYWAGYTSANGYSTITPDPKTAPHGKGRSVNLLFTDGHVSCWTLPADMLPIWAWFDGSCYSEATYVNTFYSQNPWWFVRADMANQ